MTIAPTFMTYMTVLMQAFGLGADTRRAELEATFTSAIRTHDSLIRRICFGYANCVQEFEDLRQDVLINIWQGLPRFEGNSSLKTWIYRVALNTCVSTLRNRSRLPHRVDGTDAIINVMDDSAERQVMLLELHDMISRLSPVDKAITLLWLEGQSYDEIADIVGMPRNTVASRLRRSRIALSKLI